MPENNPIPSARPSLADYVDAHGSLAVQHVQQCLADIETLDGSDLADIAHFLCVLHGRHPGVVDHAATRTADNGARQWLIEAMEAFSVERAFLTRLTVAAGPISGVGGQDESQKTVLAQRKALDMLAQSDREGCAVGAALALVLDWHGVRPLLEQVALRLGVEPRSVDLPGVAATEELAAALGESQPIARAINFGADQVLTQHRGLWQLLAARKDLRSAG